MLPHSLNNKSAELNDLKILYIKEPIVLFNCSSVISYLSLFNRRKSNSNWTGFTIDTGYPIDKQIAPIIDIDNIIVEYVSIFPKSCTNVLFLITSQNLNNESPALSPYMTANKYGIIFII
jgi:hypothetical protein